MSIYGTVPCRLLIVPVGHDAAGRQPLQVPSRSADLVTMCRVGLYTEGL